MDLDQIKINATLFYFTSTNKGKGEVKKVYKKKTGSWVTLFDAKRNKSITVRPGQLGKRAWA
jgi:hypothetical protein